MDTFDMITYICKKRDEFVAKGLNVQDALTKAKHITAEEYHLSFASINKLLHCESSFGIGQSKATKKEVTAY